MTKNKILIIGSGKDICKTFKYTFQNHHIENLSFRDSWQNFKKIKKKEKILVSGFHFEMCNMRYKDFLDYIDKYYNFLIYLRKNCKELYFVSTDLSVKLSLSRVVFFYFELLSKIKKKPINKMKILMFYTLIGFKSDHQNKFKIILLKFFKIKTMNFKKMKFLLNKNFLIKNYRINFLFLKIRRPRQLDRIIRLFIDLIFLKIITK